MIIAVWKTSAAHENQLEKNTPLACTTGGASTVMVDSPSPVAAASTVGADADADDALDLSMAVTQQADGRNGGARQTEQI
jgi:hypothetical protein